MNAQARDIPIQCPDRETLAAFQVGKLTWAELESVGEHLSQCDLCVSHLEAISRESEGDPLLEQVRDCLLDTSFDQEPDIPPASLSLLNCEATVAAPAARRQASRPLPTSIGPYEILELIGKGGMGVVYRARHRSLRREVALKVISTNISDEVNAHARFQTEGAAIARLEHRNVVRIHELNEDDGTPFFAMELVEGGNLSQRLRAGALEFRVAAELVRQLAEGVAFAHASQVLHRDLKPANVLLGSDGTPKLADFGLAKLLDDDSDQTATEMLLGTPSYMAPEQVSGNTKEIGPATDIWALGIILYECLAGRPPFRGSDRAATFDLICNTEPDPLTKFRNDAPAELEAVCRKCLEKNRARRYDSAQHLADDLNRWLGAERTHARPPTWAVKAWRASRSYVAAMVFAIGLAFAIPALAPADPNQVLREIQRKLETDNQVTLIGEKGKPAWMRVDVGEDKTQFSIAEDGTFAVRAWQHSMITLLPEAPEEFTLTAEVRHDQGSLSSKVGIFVAGARNEVAGDLIHSRLALRFNDRLSVADRSPLMALEGQAKWKPNPDRHLNVADMEANYLGMSRPHKEIGIIQQVPLARSTNFRPAGVQGETAWRKLRIMVRKDRLIAGWENETLRPLAWDDIAMRCEEILRLKLPPQLASKFSLDDRMIQMPSSSERYGAVGIVLHDGAARFKSVCLEK